MSGFRTTCPYCDTELQGTGRKGAFVTFAGAMKAMAGHLHYVCVKAPPSLTDRQVARIAESSVSSTSSA